MTSRSDLPRLGASLGLLGTRDCHTLRERMGEPGAVVAAPALAEPGERIDMAKVPRWDLKGRIAAKTVVDADGCWIWDPPPRPGAYGNMSVNGVNRGAHRVSYEVHVGPIPAGMQLDHLCRNRACVNPDHLEPVTPRENTLRSPVAVAAVNAAKTHCPKGHLLDAVWRRGASVERGCRTCARDRERERSRRRRMEASG